jgi:hypothetical protein
MFRSQLLISLLTASVALGACVADEGDVLDQDTETGVDQAVTAPLFRLQSAQFPGEVIAPLNTAVGATVTLTAQTGSSKEFWRFQNQQLVNSANPGLCLQASSTTSGAGLFVAACVDPFDISINPPQFWKLHLRANGNTQWENLVSNFLLLDASASKSTVRIKTVSGLPAQEFKRLF